MIKKILRWIDGWLRPIRNAKQYAIILDEVKRKLEETKMLAAQYEKKIADADKIYTTIRTFHSEDGDKAFWPWVRSIYVSDEYRYLVFLLRENTIREYTQTTDIVTIHEINGKLKMLSEMDALITQGLRAYEQNKV
jgi:hypothetical protein